MLSFLDGGVTVLHLGDANGPALGPLLMREEGALVGDDPVLFPVQCRYEGQVICVLTMRGSELLNDLLAHIHEVRRDELVAGVDRHVIDDLMALLKDASSFLDSAAGR